jgi:hypothetical protein
MEWRRLFPTSIKKPLTAVVVDDIMTDTPPPTNNTQTKGNTDFNIVLVVQEHAPKRIDEIVKTIADYERQIKKLRIEAGQLRRLVNVINPNIETPSK